MDIKTWLTGIKKISQHCAHLTSNICEYYVIIKRWKIFLFTEPRLVKSTNENCLYKQRSSASNEYNYYLTPSSRNFLFISSVWCIQYFASVSLSFCGKHNRANIYNMLIQLFNDPDSSIFISKLLLDVMTRI
jgi:hypothetical protein